MALSMQNTNAKIGADTIIVDDVGLRFGGVSALVGVSLKVREGALALAAAIAPNCAPPPAPDLAMLVVAGCQLRQALSSALQWEDSHELDTS